MRWNAPGIVYSWIMHLQHYVQEVQDFMFGNWEGGFHHKVCRFVNPEWDQASANNFIWSARMAPYKSEINNNDVPRRTKTLGYNGPWNLTIYGEWLPLLLVQPDAFSLRSVHVQGSDYRLLRGGCDFSSIQWKATKSNLVPMRNLSIGEAHISN